MFISNIFNFNKKCQHEKVRPDIDSAYCPDCGKLIKNDWYITRCSCCGVKLKTNIRNGRVFPFYTYCSNCGTSEFQVEKLDSINFVDINFAVLQRTVIEEMKKATTTQCWQEKTSVQPKLLVQYL